MHLGQTRERHCIIVKKALSDSSKARLSVNISKKI